MMQSDPEAPPPPGDSQEGAVEKSRPRTNGWVYPWHPLQVAGWGFIVLFAVIHFGFLVFYVPGYWRIPAYIIPGLLVLTHMICNFVTTSLNPAEPSVRLKGQRSISKFNPAKHKHVIENLYCNLCGTNVSSSAKHCRICDKCVMDFDHHCKWLNTCIGKRNYRWFLATIFSALLGGILILVYSSSLFIVYFVDRDLLRYDCQTPTNFTGCDPEYRVFGAVMPHQVFPTLCGVVALLATVAVILDGHLCMFHVYLLIRGLSTYDYIALQRQKDEARKHSSHQQRQNHRFWCCRQSKINRVSPSVSDLNGEPSLTVKSPPSETQRDSHLSTLSIDSAGMATFGRTPPLSEHFGSSTGPQELTSMVSPDGPISNTVIEMDTLMDESMQSHPLPVAMTSNTGQTVKNNLPMMNFDPNLPEHVQSPPPVNQHVTIVTTNGADSGADQNDSGSVLVSLAGADSHHETSLDDCHKSSILSARFVSISVNSEEAVKEEQRKPVDTDQEIPNQTRGGFSFKNEDLVTTSDLHPLSLKPLPSISDHHSLESFSLQMNSKVSKLAPLKTGSSFSLPDNHLLVRTLPTLTPSQYEPPSSPV